MTCIFLTGDSILSCKANKGVYIPSIGELKRFCTNTGHPCPAYAVALKGDEAERDAERWSLVGHRERAVR